MLRSTLSSTSRPFGPSLAQPARSMATLKEIQLRLKSITNIAKITKSMKMIASTKLTRAQRNMESARAYGLSSAAAVKFIEPKRPEQGKQLLVACAGDRGLCGAVNSSVAKPVKAAIRKSPETTLVAVVGDKPKGSLSREGRNNFVYTFGAIGKATPSFAEASSVAELIMSSKVEFAEASILYNRFKSVIMYELDTMKSYPSSAILNAEKLSLFEIEDDVMENYAEFIFANSLYHALAEGHASEIAARRTAMENATKNAGDMIERLTKIYNRSRQAAITNDLVDIITGASAL